MPIARRTLLSVVILSVVIAGAAHTALAAPDDAREAERGIGSPQAKHTVVEFFSLTCPHCADFALESLPELKARWIVTGKVRWVFYDLPTDGLALQAAMVARYLPPDRYEHFINTLFASQSKWAYGGNPQDALRLLASDAGMDAATFNRAIADTNLRDWIVSRATDAEARWQVNSTPSFLVDGKLYVGAMSAADFSAILAS